MKKVWTNREFFTYSILFVLLAIRIFVAEPVWNFEQMIGIPNPLFGFGIHNKLHDFLVYLLFSWCFLTVSIVLIINKYNLKKINIDREFIFLFGIGCLSYWKYFQWPSGWIVLSVPVVMGFFYKKREFQFAKSDQVASQTLWVIIVLFLLSLLFKAHSLRIANILGVIHSMVTQMPLVLIEEVIFRGLLWDFLTNLNWKAPKIVALQAVLFWVSHTNYMYSNPHFFWVFSPIASIILGIIVWRTKSISVSFLTHIFVNFFWYIG